jgi:hypothetical protein
LIDNISDTNWFYTTRFDIGGFGVGSDLTWLFDLGGGYEWDNGWQAVAKYKRLDIDSTKPRMPQQLFNVWIFVFCIKNS